MSEQPIVPLTKASRQFEHRNRNDLLLKCRLGKLDLSLYSSLNEKQLELILDRMLAYDHSTN